MAAEDQMEEPEGDYYPPPPPPPPPWRAIREDLLEEEDLFRTVGYGTTD